MTEAEIAKLAGWLAKVGLEGRSETVLVEGFCLRAVAAGVPLARAIVFIDTLHPVHEGRAFRWEREKPEATLTEYGRSTEGEAAERWRTSPWYRMLEDGNSLLRRRIAADGDLEFPMFADLRTAAITDFVAILNRFAADGAIGEMDCFYSSWMTDRAEGFTEDEVAALTRLTPFLGLAIKAASLGRIAETLVETYLGRDAGRRVLQGRIARGVADRIKTVLWFSDLRNYTRISDTSPPEQIIPLLNDYADAIVSAVHEHSGDVLKLIGDGVLAIFPAEDRARACAAALDAAKEAREAVAALNARRAAEGLPTTEMYLGLHLGVVFYGNIGSKERLDFTVVGPAVNEVSRIATMCRSVDQPILISSAFAESVAAERRRFASVGRYALRGVGKPQDLFTLDTAF
ncbi:MAG: adenylate/guanylate cyclase domain-containing protein [Hyphomicrobiales bacterium]|nr:adenylate/guanylate cyclase domain-containing protein [Hyphomicrobiales bacterium]MBV8441976.1 adenylate/guanylate cyclase domain-containing protein [Hyphomicrobiales bacterium]